jgi:O-antigen ligase
VRLLPERVDLEGLGRISFHVVVASVLLAASAVFGGGGSPAPFPELVVQLVAIACWMPLLLHWRPVDPLLLVGIAAVAAIPTLQLIPLPPVLWQALPGRGSEVDALRLVGAANRWMPLSLSPPRTLASLMSLIPPLTAAVAVAQSTLTERQQLIRLLAVLSLIGGLVGGLQLLLGHNHALRFYAVTHYGFATGFFANRNAAADQFLIGALACIYLAAPAPMSLAIHAALATFLVLMTVLTGSRAGIALLLVPILYALIFAGQTTTRRRLVWGSIGGALVALAIVGVALGGNAVIERSLVRFAMQGDLRTSLSVDTEFAIEQSWPAGTGLGTFTPVFVAGERLEAVGPSWPNRAHQDYLEYTLETGIAGPLLLVATMLAIAWRVWRVARGAGGWEQRDQVRFAVGGFAVLALHSLVDYPLRTMALATLAAFLIALIGRLPLVDNTASESRVDAT